MVWPITIGIIVVFMCAAVVVAVVVGNRQQRRDRYLSVIARTGGDGREENKDKTLAKQRAEIAKKLKDAGNEQQEKKKDKVSLRSLMQQAGFDAPVTHYWAGSAIFAVIVWIILFLTSWPIVGKVFVVFTAFLGIPKLFLKWRAGRRQKKFLVEFADALDAMARLLQAGMPMTEAIAMASREYTGPLKEEMMRMYENQKIGVPIGEAALISARRVPLPEVHMFATALQIQSETGSSLSEVLQNLSAVIRSRFRLKRKVQALSSEAKSSAAIIGCLPLLVTGGLYLARPEYISILFTAHTGKILLSGCCIWMSFGILMMRQMINFRV